MAFGNLTVDFRQLSRIPVRDRAELLRSPQASEIFGNMTPSQIAQLVPSYYRNLAQGVSYGAMGGAMSGAMPSGGSPGTAQVYQSDNVKRKGQEQQQKRLAENPIINEMLTKDQQQQFMKMGIGPGQQKLLNFIATGEGGYNSSNRGTIGNDIIGSTHNTQRGGKIIPDMTVAEIMKYQAIKDPNNPDRLFAVGKYQLIPNTFKGAVDFLGLKPDDKLTPEIQEKMGLYLIMNKPGREAIRAYLTGQSNDLQAAHKALALEFASIPLPVGMNVQGYGFRPAGASAYGSGNSAAHTIAEVTATLEQARQEIIESQSNQISPTIPGTDGITTANPEGADEGAVMPLLKGQESAATATAVPAGEVAQRTMILSLGTNDWNNSASTYQNTLDAINAAKEKGYQVVVVPPTGSSDKFKNVHDAVIKAATESGATIEQPQKYGPDGYHPTVDEYKRIGEKYAGAVVVGDSIANGIGQHVSGGQTVAKDGLNSSVIRTNMLSDDVPKNVAVAPQTQTFNVEVFTRLDPRIKQEYDKSSPEKRVLIERAIMNLGEAEINDIAAKHPSASPQVISNNITVDTTGYVEMANQGAGRYNPIDKNLETKIGQMVADVYGPQYKAVVYSGGEPTSGGKVSESGRHDVAYDAEGNVIGGQAADVYIVNRETGQALPREQQTAAVQYWQANQFGGVGLGMEAGGLHLDQIQRGAATGEDLTYRAWAYGNGKASQRFLTETERAAMVQARSEGFDINTIAPYKKQREIEAQSKQIAPQPPGVEPQTQTNPPGADQGAVLPSPSTPATVAPSATPAPSLPAAEIEPVETQPNMKLGGVANLVDEQITVKGADGKGFNFNQNEEVTIKDGKATVQNEFKKQTEETKRKTDANIQNQASMRSVTPTSTNDFLGQAKHMEVPYSPSAQRHFAASRFNDKHFRGNGARNGT